MSHPAPLHLGMLCHHNGSSLPHAAAACLLRGLHVQGPLRNSHHLALLPSPPHTLHPAATPSHSHVPPLQVAPQRQGPSQMQRLGDTQVMDITAPAWECLDEGSWVTGAAAKRQHTNYCAFHGNKLYTLRPGK